MTPEVVTIDPLLCSAWCEGYTFAIDFWARDHPEVLASGVQVIGACRVDNHWVPFHVVPCKGHANVYTWDAPSNDHCRFNAFLESLVRQLGFGTFLVSRQQRLVPVSEKCGALAIHFLRSALHGTQLPHTSDETGRVHAKLRQGFVDLLNKSEYVIRPWIWGSGDAEETDQNAQSDDDPEPDALPDTGGGPLLHSSQVGRIFDEFSPQSDPDLDFVASDVSSVEAAEDNPEVLLDRPKSRSPRRFASEADIACPASSVTVPAPDADGLRARESGPLPIMPEEGRPHWQHGDLVFQVGADLTTVQFAGHSEVVPGRSVKDLFDVGAYSRELWNRVEWSAAELVALSPAQMLQVAPPTIDNPTKLWSIRNQVMSSRDRLAVLRNQLGVVADEIHVGGRMSTWC